MRRKEFAKLFLDFAKLIFGGIILSTIIKKEIATGWVLAVSGILVATFIFIGLLIFKKEDK
jgi:hypothetical protein